MMVKKISQDISIYYSPGYECYYFKYLQSLFVSLQDYKNQNDALADYKNGGVVWIEERKYESP